jgi:hypothetical protein
VPLEHSGDGLLTVRTEAGEKQFERREQKLLTRYVAWLTSMGHDVRRLKLRALGGATLWTDAYDLTDNTIIEAKGATLRPLVRMAIGQLLDYGRIHRPRGAVDGAVSSTTSERPP